MKSFDTYIKNSPKYLRLLLYMFLSSVVFFPYFSISFAQQLPLSGMGGTISLKADPANPRPYDKVHLVAESFSTDLNRSTIQWFIDGKLSKSGKALKEFDTEVGKLGTKKEIRMVATTPIGTLKAMVVLRPAQVDLLWQAHSFTPPFYKGKAHATHKSGVTVVAIPHLVNSKGIELSPQDLVYTWKENSKVQGDKSGLGKTSYFLKEISIMLPYALVSVTVSAPTDNLQAVETVAVGPEMPKLVFYEHDPLEGVKYNKALSSTYKLVNDEVTVEAVPYFFGTFDKESSDLVYEWNLNGTRITTDESKQGSITLRQAGQGGTAELNTRVTHRKNLLESSSQKISFQFEGSTNTTFSPQKKP